MTTCMAEMATTKFMAEKVTIILPMAMMQAIFTAVKVMIRSMQAEETISLMAV